MLWRAASMAAAAMSTRALREYCRVDYFVLLRAQALLAARAAMLRLCRFAMRVAITPRVFV